MPGTFDRGYRKGIALIFSRDGVYPEIDTVAAGEAYKNDQRYGYYPL